MNKDIKVKVHYCVPPHTSSAFSWVVVEFYNNDEKLFDLEYPRADMVELHTFKGYTELTLPIEEVNIITE